MTSCNDKRRHQTAVPASVATGQTPVPADATVAQTATAILKAIENVQHVRAGGLGSAERKAAYDKSLGDLFSLADRKAIHKQVAGSQAQTIPRDITEEASVTLLAESWVSQVAHYVDGIDYSTMRVLPENPKSDATVFVNAEPVEDKKRLAEIEQALAKDPPKESDGKTATAQSATYMATLRNRTIAAGFNVPIAATIELKLQKTDAGWRVSRLGVGPQKSITKPIKGTALPTP